MRRAFFAFLLCLMLLIFGEALAGPALVMDTPSVSLGQTVLFHVENAGNELRYDIYREGELLFRTGFTDQASGAYVPRAGGDYYLTVTDRESGLSDRQPFTVTGALKVSLKGSVQSVICGGSAGYTASAEGGSLPYTYTFSVTAGSERIWGRSGAGSSIDYTASTVGDLTVTCTVTDSQNASASASAVLHVTEGPGITAESADSGPFRLYGGVRTYTVHSPGLWTAETDSDFILLSRECGTDGSELVVTVLPGCREPRRGNVTLRCGSHEYGITITRLTDDGIEKEVSLSGDQSVLKVNGERMAVWENASGGREFSIVTDSDWIASASDTWITASYTPDGNLYAQVGDSPAFSRSGYILIENDAGASAYISIYQDAGTDAPDVISVTLSDTMGISYLDSVTARVQVDGEADRVLVFRPADRDPVAVAGSDAVREDGIWEVSFPIEGSGEESYLFAAVRGESMGKAAVAVVNAFSEQAAFNDLYADAEVDGDKCTVTVQVTSSVGSILLLDASGNAAGTVPKEEAVIDRYIDEENRGRFSQWTFTVPSDSVPSALQVGNEALEVQVRRKTYPDLIFSQFDGTWDTVKYRRSDLENSGCAIFTLASALRKLGIVSDDALPEALAETYAYCLVDGGTLNSTLIGNAAKAFGFRTRYDLYTDRGSVESLFAQGAMFSFSVVKGHIALADRISEDGSMIHVVDSALSATSSRLNGTEMYILDPSGAFTAVSDPSGIPGTLYYIETEAWSGGEYWLESDYAIGRGLRLIIGKE